jgi:hypothetical protein
MPPCFTFQRVTTLRLLLPRSFSTSQLIRYAARNATQRAANGTVKKSVQSPPTYQSFADSLASKSHATLLYAAPSHTLYIISCYSAATFCFAYAAYNFNINYVHPPPNINPWIPIAFGGVCFFVASFGGFLMLGPARLIKTITAVPAAQSLTKGAGKHGPLAIEIELRKMFPLPFFPARKIIADPKDMTLSRRIYEPPADPRQYAAERLEIRRRLEREQEEERRKSIWWRPLRDANRAFYKLFMAMRLVWTRESFLQLEVRQQKYKLDIGGGWALDEGKALDRLVPVKALK